MRFIPTTQFTEAYPNGIEAAYPNGIKVANLILRKGDQFSVIRRSSGDGLVRLSDCTGHRYTIKDGQWKQKHATSYLIAFCEQCTKPFEVKVERVITTEDLIKDFRSARPSFVTNPEPVITLEQKEAMFTTHTAEIKAGVVGQVKFEGKIVWESEPFEKGEYDSGADNYPGVLAANNAAVKAKQDAVESLFVGID